MFVEVTCRDGIFKVTQERRLQKVSVALAENLCDRDLYEIYMVLLYDLESWLCHFPPGEYLQASFALFNQHLNGSWNGVQFGFPFNFAASPLRPCSCQGLHVRARDIGASILSRGFIGGIRLVKATKLGPPLGEL
ncbi:hypothetical protein GQ457_04G026440 [Hibiscus cannabinus]